VLNANGRELLTVLAQQLSSVPNSISIEGHTDSLPSADDADYGNWELSAGRANAASRLMQDKGLHRNQVSQVRGYADQRLRLPNNPLDPSNRRISLIVQNHGRAVTIRRRVREGVSDISVPCSQHRRETCMHTRLSFSN
jgi:chemotaxis protein MotB